MPVAELCEVQEVFSKADPDVIGMLADLSQKFTAELDRTFGTNWASNEEILALVHLATSDGSTTRDLTEVSGLNRRAINRLMNRLVDAGVATLGRSPADKRVMVVTLTPEGHERARHLPDAFAAFFASEAASAARAVVALGGEQGTPGPDDLVSPLELVRELADVGVLLGETMRDQAGGSLPDGRQRAALAAIVGRDLTQPDDLARALGLTPGGVSYLVKQLDAKGLIVRRRNAVATDKRAVVLELTPEGRRLATIIGRSIAATREQLITVLRSVAAWDQAGAHPRDRDSASHSPPR